MTEAHPRVSAQDFVREDGAKELVIYPFIALAYE